MKCSMGVVSTLFTWVPIKDEWLSLLILVIISKVYFVWRWTFKIIWWINMMPNTKKKKRIVRACMLLRALWLVKWLLNDLKYMPNILSKISKMVSQNLKEVALQHHSLRGFEFLFNRVNYQNIRRKPTILFLRELY